MNWVAPIKDEETLEKFKAKLREMDDKYYIMQHYNIVMYLKFYQNHF